MPHCLYHRWRHRVRHTPYTWLGRWLTPLCAFVVSASGCASGSGPVARPTPASLPAPDAPPGPPPSAARYAIPALVTDTRYRIESVTLFERDSAGRKESQRSTSKAQSVIRLRRSGSGAFVGTGRVFGYSVSSPLSPSPVAFDSLRFDAVQDARELRVVVQPPLANECDRPETGALTLVRDLLVRVPTSVAIGETWRDSTVQIVCRASLPLIVRTAAEYVVMDVSRGDDGLLVAIRRTTTSRVDGRITSPWRSVDVVGTGSGSLDIKVSVATGAVRHVQGTSTMTMTMTDHTPPAARRIQQVTQRVAVTGDAISN